MSTWPNLTAELDQWEDAGREATFWWRDDDATDTGPELSAFLSAAAETGMPLALAVIPEPATAALADTIAAHDGVSVLQHGYAHRNHEPAESRKSEYGPARVREEVAAEIVAGSARLRSLFGAKALPVFVPPWNRIEGEIAARLPGLGLRGLSTFTARDSEQPVPGLRQVNTHVDLIDWRGDRRFRGDEAVLDAVIGHLRDRRTKAAAPDEPTGILSHHLIGDRRCLDFLARLGAVVSAHRAARIVSAPSLFGL